MPFVYPIINAIRDTENIMKQHLLALGWQGECETKDIPYVYANFRHRSIAARPREVFVSPDLQCPAELEAGLTEIIRRLEAGDTLRPFQSSRIADIEYNDAFLNDWGIQHLHLGSTIQPNGFVNRTGPVLLAIIERDIAALIAIKPHGKSNPNLWVQIETLEQVLKWWPTWLARFQLKSLPGEANISEEARKTLRKKHVNKFIQLSDGHLYMPAGFGMTTAGTSTRAQIAMDRTLGQVENWQEDVLNNPRKYQAALYPGIQIWPVTFRLIIDLDQDHIYATAEHSHVKVRVANL